MLDQDISTADAMRLLTAPNSTTGDQDRVALSRRRFLRLVGMGVGAGLTGGALLDAVGSSLPGLGDAAWAAPIGPDDGILLVLGMMGGNDGLNTVVPITDGNYYDQRRSSVTIAPADALRLDGTIGLHPELTTLKRFWDAGQLAIVQGVGCPQPDLSHFNSMARWMSGSLGVPSSGWLGRWLDGHLSGGPDLYAAASVGSGVPLHMIGNVRRATAVQPGKGGFGSGDSPEDARLYDAVRDLASPAGNGVWHDALTASLRDQVDVAARLKPFYPATPATGRLVEHLDIAARLINADLGFRVVEANWGSFDSHANEPWMHGERMRELDAGIAHFFSVLDPRWAGRVAVMTFSEFGRTIQSNASNGTDHGTANAMFVLGANVRGGAYGEHPATSNLGRWGRMVHTVDFRAYFTSVVDGWLGGGASSILGGTYEDLRLFGAAGETTTLPPIIGDGRAGGDGGAGGGTGVPWSPPGLATFVPLSPARIADTRDGTGGVPVRRLEPNERLRVPVIGAAGVPSGATMVAVNVTAVDVSEPTYVTVAPGGASRPPTSNLNPLPGRATPNLVLMGVGDDGHIDVHNANGRTNCIVDVFGYFVPTAGDLFTPLSPARVLDTRDGTGGTAGPVGRHRPIDLQVAGRGGVPAGVSAVVLNVTVDQPSSGGYVTVGPTGEGLPATSNLNFPAGQTVPNLVICKVGANGAVSIATESDSAHLIADVFGYFSSSGSRGGALSPVRLLDTRDGTGTGSAGAVGPGHEVVLRVAGRGGVPSGATAVVLNVTATSVTHTSYVTVWPDGDPMAGTSNLNMVPGATAANLVVTKLGAGGRVRLANANGTADLLADVLGYFAP